MADEVVRVGDTVRRPSRTNTPLVQLVLREIEAAGFAWAPRFLGVDSDGREILSWLPGTAAASPEDVDLPTITRIVRELHDVTASLGLGDECVLHDDLQPRNVIVAGEGVVGLIDWEQVRPGPRVEDIAGLCWSFSEPLEDLGVKEVGDRWRLVLDVYGFDRPELLVPTMLHRTMRCAEDIRRNASAGSARHRALLERGELDGIVDSQRWIEAHAAALADIVGRS